MSDNSLDILTQSENGNLVPINGENLEIKAFKLASLPKILASLRLIMTDIFLLLEPDNGIVFEKGKNFSINDDGWNLINDVISRNIESIVVIMSVYTGRSPEWFLDEKTGIDIEDALVLLLTILEKHYDFFMKRLAPMIQRVRAKAKKK